MRRRPFCVLGFSRQWTSTTRRVLVPPIPLLSGPAVRLFLTSMAILFVELLLIRWIPANVIYVGYFSNFILIASFLGIGLGILFGRAWGSSAVSPFALLLFGVVVLVLRAQLEHPNRPRGPDLLRPGVQQQR